MNKMTDTRIRRFLQGMTPLRQASIKAQMADRDLGSACDEESWRRFLDAMDDDMNTPNAYAEIFDTVKKLNAALRQKEIDYAQVGRYYRAVEKMLGLLGITVDIPVLTAEDREAFARWNQAKAEKDFARADEYRQILSAKGLL